MSDLLDMEYINSLPQTLWVGKNKDSLWPVYDICVETGLVRIDVCGLLEVWSIGEIIFIQDAKGNWHYPDDFYSDSDRSLGIV